MMNAHSNLREMQGLLSRIEKAASMIMMSQLILKGAVVLSFNYEYGMVVKKLSPFPCVRMC
jgi:hypothetical protein